MSRSGEDPATQLARAAQQELGDFSRVIICDAAGAVLHSTFQNVSPRETKTLAAVMASRELAIRNGFAIQGRRYEVHQHHPLLVYGRSMQGDPESSPGAVVCQGSLRGVPTFVAATYELPATSARMVGILRSFCRKYCELQ